MNIIEDPEIIGIPEEKRNKLDDSTVIVKISCNNCTARRDGCQRRCPQYKAFESDAGKRTADELLDKGRRAYKHKDVRISFTGYMSLIGLREGD